MKKRFRQLQIKQISDALKRIEPLRSVERPRSGWIRAIRTALGMPQDYLARRLGITKAAVAKYEANEAAGAITVATLRKAAEALDCDFVYALVPRTPIEQMQFRRAEQVARRTIDAVAQSMALENQSVPEEDLAARVRELATALLEEHPRTLWKD